VQIGPADSAAGYLDYGVAIILNLRIGNCIAANVGSAMPNQRSHKESPIIKSKIFRSRLGAKPVINAGEFPLCLRLAPIVHLADTQHLFDGRS
jgi:hypothetical protein